MLRQLFLACLVLTAALPGPVRAAAGAPGPDQTHEDPPLAADALLTLTETVSVTAERYGLDRELAAGRRVAQRIAEQADLTFAQAPAMVVRNNRDWPGEGLGLSEWEAQLQLTLKRPGTTPAQEAWSLAANEAATRDLAANQLMIAGLVRETLWDIRMAAVSVTAAEAALKLAEEVESLATLRHAEGDLSRSDLLLARGDTLARRRALDAAMLTRVDAERAYMSLSGLDRQPEAVLERPIFEFVPEQHPALIAADAAVERANRALASQRLSNGYNPTIQIGPRWERGDRDPRYADSFGFQLTLPFGNEPYVDSTLGSTERAITDAELARMRLHRELSLAWHEAHHEWEVAGTQLERAREWQVIAEEREQISELAFNEGELDLTEFLRIRNEANQARSHSQLMTVRLGRAQAMLNQAAGHMPVAMKEPSTP